MGKSLVSSFTENKKENPILIQNRITANRLNKLSCSSDKQVLDIYIEYLELIGEGERIFSETNFSRFSTERDSVVFCKKEDGDGYNEMSYKRNLFCICIMGLY